jgi:hypothetical protein
MKEILTYRARGLLCRQQAVLHPEDIWKWLAEAERLEHLAGAEIASRVKECNTTSSGDLAKPGAPSNGRDTRREMAAAA